ncbi:MAG: hypothetical protein CPSOU_0329 [uncultured Paraburkholderia sp.]|nr:MAG: hypothetical protein CPSOU_0329 [uncultured Paraburkholderia sp.]
MSARGYYREQALCIGGIAGRGGSLGECAVAPAYDYGYAQPYYPDYGYAYGAPICVGVWHGRHLERLGWRLLLPRRWPLARRRIWRSESLRSANLPGKAQKAQKNGVVISHNAVCHHLRHHLLLQ